MSNPNPERDERVSEHEIRCSCRRRVPKAIVDAVLAQRHTGAAADSAKQAAEEIAEWMNWRKNIPQAGHEQNVATLTNMLSKYFAAAPADSDAESEREPHTLEVCKRGHYHLNTFGHPADRLCQCPLKANNRWICAAALYERATKGDR